MFGRGFEEIEACRAAGVPVRVIPGLSSPLAVPAAGRHPGHPPRRRPRLHRRLRPPAARPRRLAGRLGRARPPARHAAADDGGRERAATSPTALLAAGRPAEHPGRRRLRRVDAGGADRALHPRRARPPTSTGTPYARRRSSWSATSSPSPTPTPSVVGRGRAHGRADRGHRPGRPAARRLPRPARRPAAHPPRGRARAVPGRGREGRTPGGRGRLHAALVPDGAALARRPRRRARPRPTRPATSSARRWPSRSPASTSTAAPSPRSSGGRCRPSTRCSPVPARCWCSRTWSTTPTSAPSSAAAPPSASTPCCSRRAAPTRSTAARSRSAWVRSSRRPWTRLPDWYDALPDLARAGLHHRRADPGRRRRPGRGRRRRARPGRAGAGLRGPRALAALGATAPTAAP